VSPEAKGSHGDWDVVLETSQAYEAEFAALRLREAGLDARVIDQSYRQEPLPGVRSFALVRVLVPTAAAGEARGILAAGPALAEGVDLSDEADDDTGSDER
jgi:hypothetical protein